LKYNTTDLAVIIPTKDRPVEVKRHLQSLLDQKCKLGRVIVVASGQDIKDVVLDFNNKLPVEYYRSEPGQIRQRNLGISKLDEKTKLVAAMDDDVTYHEDAVEEMIRFWDTVPSNTAGVGFNIVNLPSNNHNWFRGLLGFSTPKPGRVLKSGFNTTISNVSEDIRVEWLNGGSTVWRQDVLMNNPHKVLDVKWAVGEDLIFSYPLGKQHPLFICSCAKVEIEEMIIGSQPKEFYFNRGKSSYILGLYFILQNKDLSRACFIINKFLYLTALFVKGILFLDITKFYYIRGMIDAFFKSKIVLFGFQTIDEFKIEYIN
jgi:glycosyltransferase involved in cell wall biosynthesis